MKQCRSCNTRKAPFWFLTDYYKISGTFCSPCYDKVSHDSYGRPERPNDYLLMLLKFGASK
jgi:hypothetical protein